MAHPASTRYRTGLTLAFLLICLVTAVQAADDGAMFRVDPEHTGVIDPEGYQPVNNLLWSYATGAEIFSSPAAINGTVFVANDRGDVYAFDAYTGEKAWNISAVQAVELDSSPAVHDNFIWVGSNISMYALDAATGAELWHITGSYPGSAVIDNGVVYFGNVQRNISAFDESTRQQIWKTAAGMMIQSTPAVDVGTVYVEGTYIANVSGNLSGISMLKAFFRSNGTLKWERLLAGAPSDGYWIPQSSPALGNGLIFIGTSWNRSTVAVFPGNGTIKWTHPAEGYVFSSPAVETGAVYGADLAGNVFRLDPSDGSLVWNTGLPGEVKASPVIIGDHLYVGCGDGKLYAIEKESGGSSVFFDAGSEIKTDVTFRDGILFFGSGEGVLYALGPEREPPASITDLHNTTYLADRITWAWEDPADQSFTGVMVYLDGNFSANVTKDIETFTASGLQPATNHTISTRTVGIGGIINQTWVNQTARTAEYTCVPDSITGLHNTTYEQTSITWAWEDPVDPCFEGIMVYLEGLFVTNISDEVEWFTASNLTPATNYTIGTRAIGAGGALNQTWVNSTAKTAPEVPVPPEANFTANQTSGLSPLTVQFTSTSTGSAPLTYLWTFDDGSNATIKNPVHTFTATTNTTYTVTLNVTNSAGSSTKTMPITVNLTPVISPVANFTANQTSGMTPLAVQFTSTSTGSEPLTYLWTFGDGTNATIRNPVHTFTATTNTTYTVVLNVTNSAGSSMKTMAITVNITLVIPPEANFTANQTTGMTPLAVQFTGTSTGSEPLTYLWTFGDGTNATIRNPVHTFTATTNTTYTVVLNVTNSAGSSMKTVPLTVNVTPPSGTGSVFVYSYPSNASIVIDGTVFGTTNQIVPAVPAGVRNLTLTKAGYYPAMSLIEVIEGELKVLAPISLKPIVPPPPDGMVWVYSVPANATITIDGTVRGTTNMLVAGISPGFHNLTLMKEGFQEKTIVVNVPAGDVRVLAPIDLVSL